jgi:hypothetical protein
MDPSEQPFDGEPIIFIITGRVSRYKGGKQTEMHVIVSAPDDDTAVRTTLDAMAREGYAEAELDQIGVMDSMPQDEPHMSAYQGALDGEVAIITF